MKVAIGQDSHRFGKKEGDKKLILGGVVFEEETPLIGNSDTDVVLHALTNAISGITGRNVLGKVSDEMCQKGIIDSKEYVKEAKKDLQTSIVHVSFSIEAKYPKISPKVGEMRKTIAELLEIGENQIGITATTGEELTECGKGNGISVFCCITVE